MQRSSTAAAGLPDGELLLKAPTASLVQYTCYGDPAQQWYLGGAASGKNIGGLSTALKNRNSG